MDKFAEASQRVESQTSKTEKGINTFDDAVQAISPSTLSAVAGITALIGTLKGLSSAFSTALDNYSHFEKMQMGLETFFQDADKGKEKFEELRRLSNETTFGVDELTDSFTQLANVGVNVDTIKDKLVMLGNIAGGDKAKFAELTSIYAKINATGKASAMQLQQIATRGVPIYDVLKKIGVQGNATADDITKAFEQMTDAGGQFHGAMENINKTIEGKEGFISDYFKEMTVNFAEVTGLADMYKKILDALLVVISAVSDKFLEWSENPVMKAIMTGVFVGAITALVTVIGATLIPKLVAIIGHLITINLLSGPQGWAVLAVAGIGAVTAGFISYQTSAEKAREETEKLTKSIEEQKKVAEQNDYYRSVGKVPLADTRKEQIEQLTQEIEGWKFTKEEIKKLYDNQLLAVEQLKESWGYDKSLYEQDDLWEETNGKLNEYLSRLKYVEEEEKKRQDRLDALNQKQQMYNNLLGSQKQFKEIYESTLPKEEQEITYLKEQIALVQEYSDKLETAKALKVYYDDEGNFIDYNKEKEEIDKTMNYLQEKLDELLNKDKGIIKWQDFFEQTTGIKIIDNNGKQGALDYLNKLDVQKNKNLETAELLGKDKKKVALDSAKEVMATIEKLMKATNLDENFSKLDGSISTLMGGLDLLEAEFIDLGGTSDEFKEALGQVTQATEIIGKSLGQYVGETALNQLTSHSGDLSSAIEGFQNGGIWGAVFGTLINAFFNVASSVEGFEEVMNPVTTAMEQLKPFIQWLVEILARYTKHLEAVFNIIGELFEALEPLVTVILDSLIEPLNFGITIVAKILKLLVPILKVFAEVLSNVVKGLSGGMIDMMKDVNDEFAETRKLSEDKNALEKEELRRKQSLINAYASMFDLLISTQEEFERRKREINASSYYDYVTKVHDMILTPQGQFSTDPDDYIIATKNPSKLGRERNTEVSFKPNIVIQNYTNSNVNTSTDDMGNMVISISQKVANDFAQGNNGWDSAVAIRQARTAGRQLVM